jgi:hypothetical protein
VNNIQRFQRFLSIWRRSGRFELAVQAVRERCQAVVVDFFDAGGRVTGDLVSYRSAELPRRMFAGHDLGGLVYITQLVGYGATIEHKAGDVYAATLPNGLTFESGTGGFVDTMCMLVERFVTEEYAWLRTGGHVVIDVGANIGDSAIYFSMRGATHVYGYEPNAIACEGARRNIAANRVTNVDIIQAAIGGTCPPGDECVTFGDALRRAAAEHPDAPIACKIDCEGCEFEVFAPGVLKPDEVKPVSQLMIEYHWKAPDPIVEGLVQLGFRTEVSAGPPGVGWIRAERQV